MNKIFYKDKMTKFWLDDPNQLILNYDIIPVDGMSFEEKLNILVKFTFIVTIILAIITKNLNILSIMIAVMILTIVAYIHFKNKREQFFGFNNCIEPTINNPFMNPNIFDNNTNACPLDYAYEDIIKSFNKNIFKDAIDIYGNDGGQRQFYTMPNNEQKDFANWLYDDGKSCKEGNANRCARNLNLSRNDLHIIGA